MTSTRFEGSVARDVATSGGLYLVQGMVWGSGGLVVLPRLAAAGVSLDEQAGIFALSGVPWVLKLAWGPVLDLPAVRRVPPVLVAAIATAVIGGALAWLGGVVDPASEVARITWLWLALNVALSLQDTATDAFAIDRIPARLRGAATAVMLAGHHVGAELLAGAWVGAWVAARGLAGLVNLAWVCVAIAVVVAMMSLGDPSGSRAPAPRGAVRDAVVALVRDDAGLRVLLLATVVFAADVATSAASGQWLFDLGWSPEQIAARIVWPLLGGTLTGHLIAAVAIDRGHGHGARASAIAWSSAALGACWIGFALLASVWHVVAFVQVFVVVQAAITAVLYVAMHAALMDATAPALRATQFAALTAALNLPRVWAPLVATMLVGRTGFAAMFAICGLFQLAVAVMARWAITSRVTTRAQPSRPA